MPPAWQLSCLQSRIRSLQLEIGRVKNKDHPYPEPEIVFNALLKVVESRKRLIEETLELHLPNTPPQNVLQPLFNSVVKDLANVAHYFSLVDRVDSARIPFEILRSLSWTANLLLHEECRGVVRLDPNYNYTISSFRHIFEGLSWNREWAEALPPESDPRTTTVLVLGFPSADASSILMHALAAHELGHEFIRALRVKVDIVREESISKARRKHQQALQDYLIERSRLTGIETRAETDEALSYFERSESSSKNTRGPRKAASHSDAYEVSRKSFEVHLAKVANDWLKELFADLVAARLVGPAFLAAFDRLVLGETEPYKTHPPAGLRRKLVCDYLSGELPDIMQDTVWRELCGPYKNYEVPKDLFWRICCEVCESSLPGLTEIVEVVPSPLKKINDLKAYIEDVNAYIDNLAPPSAAHRITNDDLEANGFWLLMFCSWHFRLSQERFRRFAKRFGWQDNLPVAEEAIGNLLLHSLRSLELKHRWVRNGVA